MSEAKNSDAKIVKTDAEWRDQLTPEQFEVARCGGTERAFTGPYWDNKEDGIYHCICCDTALFDSATKYDSGTGWPSFFAALSSDCVATKSDRSHGMVRTEAVCASCESHLGHVFPDGPEPTGLRFCMNGTSLSFVPK
jgi:peptide-methionine (R)-S-oxide reductase